MKKHSCNESCRQIIKERYEGRFAAHWNSLTHEQQKEWDNSKHVAAASAFMESKRGKWTHRMMHYFRYLFTRKQFHDWLT